jgi:hypothetical protein
MGGAVMVVTGAGGSNIQVQVRKNGAALGTGRDTAMGAQVMAANSYYGDPQGTVIVDANGTDYFDLFGTVAVSQVQLNNYWFAAFPISGIQGPPGPPPLGSLSLYNEVSSVAGATDMRVTIPTSPYPKRIEIEFFMGTSDGTAQTVNFQVMQGATPVGGTAYNAQFDLGTGTTPQAGQSPSTSAWVLGGAIYWKGVLRPILSPGAPFGHAFEGNGYAQTTGAARIAINWAGDMNAVAGVTGFRLSFAAGTTLTVGSTMRCYVVV